MRPEGIVFVGVALLLGLLVIMGFFQGFASPQPKRGGRKAKPVPCRLLCEFLNRLQAAPDDVGVWYELGASLATLNHRREAKVAFQYVAQRGDPDSEAVRLARQWLIRAGALGPRGTPSIGGVGEPRTADDAQGRGGSAGSARA